MPDENELVMPYNYLEMTDLEIMTSHAQVFRQNAERFLKMREPDRGLEQPPSIARMLEIQAARAERLSQAFDHAAKAIAAEASA